MSSVQPLETNVIPVLQKKNKLSSTQKTCLLTGIALSAIGILFLVTLAITQTGALQSILSKYHIILVEQQIVAITLSASIGGGLAFLIGMPLFVIPGCLSCAHSKAMKKAQVDPPREIKNQKITEITRNNSQASLHVAPFDTPPTQLPDKTLKNSYSPREFTKLLNGGTIFLTDVIVTSDLDLRACALESLPEGMCVKGYFKLRYCSLKALPKRLCVEGNLELHNCAHLESVSEGLRVGGNLNIFDSPNLDSLTKKMDVKGHLGFFNCTRLNQIPEGLRVNRNLDIFDCRLTSLPKGLHVRGSLTFRRCPLISLPAGLFVGGGLTFYDCENLVSFSEGLHVGNDVSILSCPRFASLPEGLYVKNQFSAICCSLESLPISLNIGGNIILRGCSALRSLPNSITELGLTHDGKRREVDLTDTGLSQTIIEGLRHHNAPGMQFHFSHAGSVPEHTFQTLEKAFIFWKITSPMPKLETSTLGPVLEFLARLTVTPEYQNHQSRAGLKQRVVDAFNLMATCDDLKELIVNIITNGLTSCDDRVISALDEIELMVRVRQVGDTEAELRKLGESFLRLEMVNHQAREHIKTLTWVDEVEVFLAFQIGLAKQLELPVSTQNMIFKKCAQITDKELEAVGKSILKECTKVCVEAFLTNWDPWKRHLRKCSVTSYALLPYLYEKGKELEECPLTMQIPNSPVLYENTVYDYAAFVKWYVEKGNSPTTRKEIVWNELHRLKS